MHTVDGIHELDLKVEHDVLTFGLLLLLSSTSAITSKHLLELIENITKRLALATLGSSKLLTEAFKASKALATTKWIATEGALTSKRILSLLISSHASLIVDTSLALITKCLVSIVDFRKLLLSFLTRVHIWMVFLRKLEVSLLNISLGCISI